MAKKEMNNSGRPWTPEEELRILLDNRESSCDELSFEMGREKSSIYKKKYKIKKGLVNDAKKNIENLIFNVFKAITKMSCTEFPSNKKLCEDFFESFNVVVELSKSCSEFHVKISTGNPLLLVDILGTAKDVLDCFQADCGVIDEEDESS